MKVGDLMRSFKLLVYKAEKSALEEVDVMVHVDGYSTEPFAILCSLLCNMFVTDIVGYKFESSVHDGH